MSEETRTTCYAARVQQAAKVLGLPDGSTADDVLKSVIRGQAQATLAQARDIVNRAIDAYAAESHT